MIEDLIIRPIMDVVSRAVASGNLVTVLLVAGGVPVAGAIIIAVLRNLFARSS